MILWIGQILSVSYVAYERIVEHVLAHQQQVPELLEKKYHDL